MWEQQTTFPGGFWVCAGTDREDKDQTEPPPNYVVQRVVAGNTDKRRGYDTDISGNLINGSMQRRSDCLNTYSYG